MESRSRFSGTLSVKNRLYQQYKAVMFWFWQIAILAPAFWLYMSWRLLTAEPWGADAWKLYVRVKAAVWAYSVAPDYRHIGDWILGGLREQLIGNEQLTRRVYQYIAYGDVSLGRVWTWTILLATTYAVVAYIIARREHEIQTVDTELRGARLMTESELQSRLGSGGELHIGKIAIPRNRENLSFIAIGAPQQGKTVLINAMLDTIVKRNDRAFVFCAKREDFLTTHYQAGDLIFAPGDARSIQWSLANDITAMSDFCLIAQTLCPDVAGSSGNSKFFTSSGRTVIEALLKYWYLSTDRQNKTLYEICNAKPRQWQKWLRDTLDCQVAANSIADPADTVTNSIVATVLDAIKPIKLLSMTDGAFSIRDYLANGTGRIYIASNPREQSMVAPLLGLFLEMVMSNHLSLPQDRNRRIWYLLDELPALPKINGLEKLLNVGPSFGGACVIGTQDVGRLDTIYGQNERRAIINACSTLVAFSVNDVQTAEELSKLLGRQEVEQVKQNYSISANDAKDGVTSSTQEREKSIVMPDEIKGLQPLNLYLRVAGMVTKTKVKYRIYKPVISSHVQDERFSLASYIASASALDKPEPESVEPEEPEQARDPENQSFRILID